MRKYIISIVIIFAVLNMYGQVQFAPADVKIGAVFKVGKPTVLAYKHLRLPKANMIIKQGGIANYKRLIGSLVVVTAIKEKKNGVTMIKMKLKNGKRFFKSHTFISADLNKALESGELQAVSD